MTHEPTGNFPPGGTPPPPPPPSAPTPPVPAPTITGGGAPPPGHASLGTPPHSTSAAPAISGTAWWSVVSIVALVLAVSIPEDGDSGWENVGIWAGFVIAAAAATFAPSMREQFKLSADTAWRVAVAGGIGLAAYWVLFVLPVITQNVSFLATIGCAAGAYAAWNAPGRATSPDSASESASGPRSF